MPAASVAYFLHLPPDDPRVLRLQPPTPTAAEERVMGRYVSIGLARGLSDCEVIVTEPPLRFWWRRL